MVKIKLSKKIQQTERAAASFQAVRSLRSLGEPNQVASLVTWLLNPTNSWINGEAFSITGGFANVRAHGGKAAS